MLDQPEPVSVANAGVSAKRNEQRRRRVGEFVLTLKRIKVRGDVCAAATRFQG
jgi:hypothetical protein